MFGTIRAEAKRYSTVMSLHLHPIPLNPTPGSLSHQSMEILDLGTRSNQSADGIASSQKYNAVRASEPLCMTRCIVHKSSANEDSRAILRATHSTQCCRGRCLRCTDFLYVCREILCMVMQETVRNVTEWPSYQFAGCRLAPQATGALKGLCNPRMAAWLYCT